VPRGVNGASDCYFVCVGLNASGTLEVGVRKSTAERKVFDDRSRVDVIHTRTLQVQWGEIGLGVSSASLS
jgi:hypothetical protein